MKIKSDYIHSHFAGAMSSVLLRKRAIIRGNWTGKKNACISFDCDFPEDMEACEPIVNFLTSKDIPASFAIPGHLIREFPNVVDSLLKNGHEIVNHTLTHPKDFRNMSAEGRQFEIEGFQELMAKEHGYLPRGFRCPHGLRQKSADLFRVLEKNKMYDSSLLGYVAQNIGGIIEIPLTPCPEHTYMAFDSYHHFRFPLVCSSEHKVLKLWQVLLENNAFVNIFLDPIDLTTETRLALLRDMIRSAKNQDFTFNQMCQVYANFSQS